MTLNNTYSVGAPDHATLLIQDNDDLPAPTNVATINGPSGIGYHPANSSLIISRSDTTGADKNFKRIASNGGPPSNWSTLSGLGFTNANGSQGKTKLALSRPPQRAQDKILRFLCFLGVENPRAPTLQKI